MTSQILPPPQGPEYTPCACTHIEPEHEPNAGDCYSCDCTAYRPAVSSAGQAPATGREALRKLIAAAIHRYDNHHALSGNDIPSKHHYGEADAVLAVLPEPTGRTAVTASELAHALDNSTPYPVELNRDLCRFMAERLLEMLTIGKRPEHDVWQPEEEPEPGEQPQPQDPAELRRLADEAAVPGGVDDETRPRRGDAFEAWLKTQRDLCFGHASTWGAVDGLLDQYRLHADTGTPLGAHVCEARTVGDCECLEQPADAPAIGGAQPKEA